MSKIGEPVMPDREAAAAPRLSGEFVRQALLGKAEIPPGCPLTVDDRSARLEGAIVEDTLDLSALAFRRPIVFERCVFLGPVLMCDAQLGSVSFIGGRAPRIDAHGTEIAGDLRLAGITLECPGGIAFNGEALNVHGSVTIADGFSAKGAVDFARIRIDGALSCNHATFRNPYFGPSYRPGVGPTVVALRLNNAAIRALAFLGPELSVEGWVFARGARLGSGFAVLGGVSIIAAGGTQSGLDLMNARVGDILALTGITRFEGLLDLRATRAGSIIDDGSLWQEPETRTPRQNVTIELDGLQYSAFIDPVDAPMDLGWRTRLSWLKMQPQETRTTNFHPQPFTQCAEALRSMGHTHAARMILFERERLRLKSKNIGFWEKLGGHIVGALAGYGYKNHRALYWALGVWLLGALIFGIADRLGAMRPADPHVLAEPHYQETLRPPTDYEPLKPALFSADILIPIVDLGQQEFWLPRDAGERKPDAAVAFPWLHRALVPAVSWLFSGWLPKAYYYFEIGMGWLLVSIVIAGFSGLLGHAREE